MRNQINISVSGVELIDKILTDMPDHLSDEVVFSAHRQALKPFVEKAKLLAPEGRNGILVDSIGTQKIKFGDKQGQIQAGPRRSRRYKGYAAHLVEYGTTKRAKKSGRSTGKMPKKPFIQPAWDAKKRVVEGLIAEKIAKTLNGFMSQMIKKYS